ncbi:MAG: MarR family transcriptional regulator, partial [Muribaculaceae bacterium]|nr:MarR family transcriptional regulator [Muribaculaceae bacterium]
DTLNGANDTLNGANDTLNDTYGNLTSSQIRVLSLIRENNAISHSEIAEILSVAEITVKRITRTLKDVGLLKRIGSKKNGHWEILG